MFSSHAGLGLRARDQNALGDIALQGCPNAPSLACKTAPLAKQLLPFLNLSSLSYRLDRTIPLIREHDHCAWEPLSRTQLR